MYKITDWLYCRTTLSVCSNLMILTMGQIDGNHFFFVVESFQYVWVIASTHRRLRIQDCEFAFSHQIHCIIIAKMMLRSKLNRNSVNHPSSFFSFACRCVHRRLNVWSSRPNRDSNLDFIMLINRLFGALSCTQQRLKNFGWLSGMCT